MAITKIAFEFNPFKTTRIKVPRKNVKQAREMVQDFVKESVLSDIGAAKSPVSGGRWKKKLTKEYAKIKGVNFANLEFQGDLLDALDVKKKRGNNLSLEVVGKQAPKADGNNRGTYGRKRTHLADAREFIPKRKQTLSKEIWKGVRDILKSFQEEDG